MPLIANDVSQAERLLREPKVTSWHNYIRNSATSLPRDTLLFVPCAKAKPYLPPTKSFFYNWLWRFLEKENLRNKVFVCTVSEPFALFPETDYYQMPNYELSPLVLKSEPELLKSYCETLAKPIVGFIRRNSGKHNRILAYVRPDSTHALFLNRANAYLHKPLVEFPVTMQDLQRIRRAHRRMWHLNWMIYLEDALREQLT